MKNRGLHFISLMILLSSCSTVRYYESAETSLPASVLPVPATETIAAQEIATSTAKAPSGFEPEIAIAPVAVTTPVAGVPALKSHTVVAPSNIFHQAQVSSSYKRLENYLAEAHDAKVLSIIGLILMLTAFGALAGVIISVIALIKANKAINTIEQSEITYINEKEAFQAKSISIIALITLAFLILIAVGLMYIVLASLVY